MATAPPMALQAPEIDFDSQRILPGLHNQAHSHRVMCALLLRRPDFPCSTQGKPLRSMITITYQNARRADDRLRVTRGRTHVEQNGSALAADSGHRADIAGLPRCAMTGNPARLRDNFVSLEKQRRPNSPAGATLQMRWLHSSVSVAFSYVNGARCRRSPAASPVPDRARSCQASAAAGI